MTLVIMSIIGTRESHDYRNYNLLVRGINTIPPPPTPKKTKTKTKTKKQQNRFRTVDDSGREDRAIREIQGVVLEGHVGRDALRPAGAAHAEAEPGVVRREDVRQHPESRDQPAGGARVVAVMAVNPVYIVTVRAAGADGGCGRRVAMAGGDGGGDGDGVAWRGVWRVSQCAREGGRGEAGRLLTVRRSAR